MCAPPLLLLLICLYVVALRRGIGARQPGRIAMNSYVDVEIGTVYWCGDESVLIWPTLLQFNAQCFPPPSILFLFPPLPPSAAENFLKLSSFCRVVR